MKCAFAFVCLIPAVVLPQSLDKSIVDRIKNAVVYIEQKRSIAVSERDFVSSGTGFFVSASGHVVTNYHVVEESIPASYMLFPAPITEMRLVMNSGSPNYRTLHGRIVAVDKENDIAVLETDTSGVPFLGIGNEKTCAETTPVWAFGYPLGNAFALIQRGPEVSITRGTVSALRHNDRGVLTAVQVDAAINPGNSGGPLVDQNGTVVGIVNRVGGTTGLNFAVPLHFLDSLCRKLPRRQAWGDSCAINLVSVPAKALVFVDHTYKGETPIERLTLERNLHSLLVAKDGFESFIAETVIVADRRFDITLKTVMPVSLQTGDAEVAPQKCASLPKAPSHLQQNILFRCDFEDTGEFAKWQQETGGTAIRTWFVENGILQQYNSDEMLHAIYFGDTCWKDYALTARVKINDSHDDSRAGLIFRENTDGFYLFRIHRESNKVQLAYHSRHPFGWFVLAEKGIGATVGDAWHHMTVSASGTSIACYLDESCLFRTSAGYSARGRVGFYSVESKASFDSCFVLRPSQDFTAGAPPALSNLVSFWFTDEFDLHSTWWQQHSLGASFPQAWQYSQGGSAQPLRDEKLILGECTRYRLSDFTLRLTVSTGDSGTNSRIGVLFRKNGDNYCAVELSKKDSKVRLLQITRGKSRTLEEEEMHEYVFGRTSQIALLVNGTSVECRINDSPVLTCRKRSLTVSEGTVGLMTYGIAAVFHKMTVSSLVKKQ